MKFLFASDSFKGTFIFAKDSRTSGKSQPGRYFRTVNVTALSVADGGEGTTDGSTCGYKWEKNYLCKFMDLSGRILQVIMACWMKIVQ